MLAGALMPLDLRLNRRSALAAGLGLAGAAVVARIVPGAAMAAPAAREVAKVVALSARPARVDLVGMKGLMTDVWAYDGVVPGPTLRFRQGETARVAFSNGLPAETTIHWHGLRVPNAMDGVPHLSHPPIPPGGRFDYEFILKDAGTFWYHPHVGSSAQLARGLTGAFVVEEAEPPAVDRELLWVLHDWRLDRDAGVVDDFGNPRDSTHAGRIGNTVTLNGAITETVGVRAGERIRLRLVNTANARVFALGFTGHEPVVVALDGHPVPPHTPEGGRVVLAPGQRADLILDMGGEPGKRYEIVDSFLPRNSYWLTSLQYSNEAPLRASPLDAPLALPANPLPEPDLANAVRQDLVLDGGMHGAMPAHPMRQPGGPFWTLNGVAAMGHHPEPLITAKRGQTIVMQVINESRWWHPMHLHGFPFRILKRDGKPTAHREWRDTVLLGGRETAEIAFVAEEAGHWMLHCHILEHQETGMMAVLRVV